MDATARLMTVDWSSLPVPEDDGAARHLPGTPMPSLSLVSTRGDAVSLRDLPGRTVLFAYPMTGGPGVAVPEGWDMIPGARGCTPQSCAFRDHFRVLTEAGADHVFGLSTQDTVAQQEAAERLHLPFALLSDAQLALACALRLPVMEVAGMRLLRRLALVIDDGVITTVFYPVFPPDRNASDVLAWLKEHPP